MDETLGQLFLELRDLKAQVNQLRDMFLGARESQGVERRFLGLDQLSVRYGLPPRRMRGILIAHGHISETDARAWGRNIRIPSDVLPVLDRQIARDAQNRNARRNRKE